MTLSIFRFRKIKLCLLTLLLFIEGNAQVNANTHQQDELHATVSSLDSALFNAYENSDIDKLRSFFVAADFEFYDRSGVDTSMENNLDLVKARVENNKKLRREVVKASLQSCVIANYGAVLTGEHAFYVKKESGEQGPFRSKFIEVWKKTGNDWKITKLIDYDQQRSEGKRSGSSDITEKLARMDSSMFAVAYKCKPGEMATYFTDDLEFYHDLGGATISLSAFMENLKRNFCGERKVELRRELVSGSMNTYEFEGGAIQEGVHRFYVKENGQNEKLDGIARFIHIWLYQDGKWKISRVLSLDHRAAQ